ncbi:hypothetical protein [Vibrio harveyi]|uniref:hypothetical protein n=1 Tax=Vibrio harveyi TaxID=669 RepID=UPI00390A552C
MIPTGDPFKKTKKKKAPLTPEEVEAIKVKLDTLIATAKTEIAGAETTLGLNQGYDLNDAQHAFFTLSKATSSSLVLSKIREAYLTIKRLYTTVY